MLKIQALLLFYLLFSFLKSNGQQVNRAEAVRISPALRDVLNNSKQKDSIDVLIAVNDLHYFNVDKTGRILYQYAPANTVAIRTIAANIATIARQKETLIIDIVRHPKEELTTGALDLSTNKINLVHYHYPSINGSGIHLSIKEQQFDTTDIDIKGRYFNSGMAAPTQSSHAAIMATIIAGGGNSSSFAEGAARGAVITSSDFARLLPDPDAIFNQYHILVQNHSYGTDIANYYGADAAAYDVNVWNNPVLVHVFSAGNSGTTTTTSGTYAGVNEMANITGSFKMAKNIITVGHTDSTYTIMPLSSKGPAYDGRVKPELVAFGEDGSSGAAALVSGTVAIVQQAYYQKHNRLPTAALVKAILLNSADDVDEKGIDYTSGYGSLNADAALKAVVDNRYIEDTVTDLQTKAYYFHIPDNIAQLKFTIAWSDTAAAPSAAKALVNDIDAIVKSNGQSWLPWVLSIAPNVDSLLQPAIRKKDTLNNVEQITVDHPPSGDYTLTITGSHIATAAQPFAVACQMDTVNGFEWNYPTAADIVPAANTGIVRWQTNISGKATIEYAVNGGNWQTITTNADLSQQYYQWQTPDTIATALLRIHIPATNNIITSDTFVIAKPTNLQVGFNCADSFLLFWNKQSVDQYQLYTLGDQYLQPVFVTNDTFSILKKNQFPSLYYSVAPVIHNKAALRSFTVNYTTQGVGCYVRTFLAALQNNSAVLTADLGTIYNVAAVVFQKLAASGTEIIKTYTAPANIQLWAADTSLTRGVNRYQLLIQLTNGTIIKSNIESVYYFPDLPVIVYPNPGKQNERINIIASLPFTYSIQIFDAMGKLVQVQSLNGFTNYIPPYALAKGIYFIKIISEDGKLGVQKLIVQ